MHSYNHHHHAFFCFPTPSRPTIKPESFKFPIPSSSAFSFRLSASACSVNYRETVSSTSCCDCENEYKSLYSVLGVAETVSFKEVKEAYKKLARKYHPDVSPADRVEEYTKRFIKLKEAYETLSDPIRRSKYDRGYDRVNEWRSCWQSQLSELNRRSSCSGRNMSWAARLRRNRDIID